MPKPVKAKKNKKAEVPLTCVGMGYRMSEKELKKLDRHLKFNGSMRCKLVPEPTNEFDSDAIKVICIDRKLTGFYEKHLGYIQRPTNRTLLKVLKKGAKVRLCAMTYLEVDRGQANLEAILSVPSKSLH